jgi:hypothetical protein
MSIDQFKGFEGLFASARSHQERDGRRNGLETVLANGANR